MLVFTQDEQLTANAINPLKTQSGSHSPSVFTLFLTAYLTDLDYL